EGVNTVIEVGGQILDAVIQTFAAGVEWTTEMIDGAMKGVVRLGEIVIVAVKEAAEEFGKQLMEWGTSVMELWNVVKQFGDAAQDVMNALWDHADVFIGNIMSSLKEGIKSFLNEIGTLLKSALWDWLATKVQGLGLPELPKEWTLASTAD